MFTFLNIPLHVRGCILLSQDVCLMVRGSSVAVAIYNLKGSNDCVAERLYRTLYPTESLHAVLHITRRTRGDPGLENPNQVFLIHADSVNDEPDEARKYVWCHGRIPEFSERIGAATEEHRSWREILRDGQFTRDFADLHDLEKWCTQEGNELVHLEEKAEEFEMCTLIQDTESLHSITELPAIAFDLGPGKNEPVGSPEDIPQQRGVFEGAEVSGRVRSISMINVQICEEFKSPRRLMKRQSRGDSLDLKRVVYEIFNFPTR
ncbi:hypothetical protein BD779DRAFT_1787810 [Infundibulicybe gibba]|nr:hypothetical protein BD779DRAFT_1787810 [Infundibulicybe gibba]